MAIFNIPSDRIFVGPRGGLYRVEQGRKIYDIAPAKPVALASDGPQRVFAEDYEELEEESAPGFWGVVWFLVCAPFRFLGFCGEHGGGIGWLIGVCLVSSLLFLALQGLDRLFCHFAGLLQAAHLIG